MVAGDGQSGTDEGPCAVLGSWPDNKCYGFSVATWELSDNDIESPITDLFTNEQTLIGKSNMAPPGYFDTDLSSTGFYAIKISTDNIDNDSMGFVFVSIPVHPPISISVLNCLRAMNH